MSLEDAIRANTAAVAAQTAVLEKLLSARGTAEAKAAPKAEPEAKAAPKAEPEAKAAPKTKTKAKTKAAPKTEPQIAPEIVTEYADVQTAARLFISAAEGDEAREKAKAAIKAGLAHLGFGGLSKVDGDRAAMSKLAFYIRQWVAGAETDLDFGALDAEVQALLDSTNAPDEEEDDLG